MTPIVPQKRCTKCGEEKPATVEYFSRTSMTKSGIRSRCKSCERIYRKEYEESNPEKMEAKRQRDLEYANRKYRENPEYRAEQQVKARGRSNAYYHQNKDEILERDRARRKTDEFRTRSREYQKKRKENPDIRQNTSQYAKAYYQRNRSQILSRVADYNRQNPQVMKATRLRRKARKRSLPNTFEARHWVLCLEYWRNRCAACDSQLRDLFGEIEPHADHWIPLNNPACFGTTPDNMICLCSTCNQSKSDKPPERWLLDTFGKRRTAEILKRVKAYFEWIMQQ